MRIGFFDLEANGLLDTVTKMHCCVVKDKATNEVRKFWPWVGGDYVKQMLEYLESFDVLIAHNALGYDFPLLKQLYGWEYKGKKVDTLIMSRLLNPKRQVPFNCPDKGIGPHGIQAWGYRVGRGKPEHNDWEVFSEAMLHRCTEDVEILSLVYDELMKESKNGKWKNAFLLSFKLFENLQKQEQYGWLVDQGYMKKNLSQLSNWIRRIDLVLVPNLPLMLEVEETKTKGEYNYIKKPFLKSGAYSKSSIEWYASTGISPNDTPIVGAFSRISFRRINLNSNAETKNYLLDEGWEPLEWNTNDDGERTSPKMSKDDPFEGINGKVGKLVAKRVQCRQRHSIINGLYSLVRADGRIASVVNTLAVTGRATHRNIVNIPQAKSFYGKQMRKMFTSKEGFVVVGTDSDACQIRMLCGRMNDPAYTDNVLNGNKDDGSDIHSVNMRAAGLNSRDDAKTFFYGFLFGAGDAKIGKIVKGTSADGKRLKAQFLQGLPALGNLLARLTKEWKGSAKSRYNAQFNRMEYYDGYITGLDGRPIKVPSEHQVLVYLLQSDEAIMMTAAYNKANKDMERAGYIYGKDYGFVCWYHDEFTIECRKEISQQVKEISEQAIAWAGDYYKIPCPHIGQGKIGKNWYEIH
jgi:DNA polymerase I-like protein with 3'-5' exonuclease and polymerase domains